MSTGTDANVIKFRTVYAVHEGDGERSCGEPRWWFSTPEAAEHVRQGRGYFGGQATVTTVPAIDIPAKLINPAAPDDSPPVTYILPYANPIPLDVGPEDESAAIDAALAKLTGYERQLLGLT